MKKLFVAFFLLLSVLVYAQPQTAYVVQSVIQMKAYFGQASRITQKSNRTIMAAAVTQHRKVFTLSFVTQLTARDVIKMQSLVTGQDFTVTNKFHLFIFQIR